MKILDDSNESILAVAHNQQNYWLLLYYLTDKLPDLLSILNVVFNDTKAIEGLPTGKETSKSYPFISLLIVTEY
jgi:hypothetical protein